MIKIITVISSLGILCVVLVFIFFISRSNNPAILSPTYNTTIGANHETKQSENLKNIVLPYLENNTGTYGIVIKHLQTGELYMINENRIFDTGSLYKLWVMGAAYEKIEKGTLNKNTVLKQEIVVLNEKFNIASESAEETEGSIELRVEDSLFNMITFSDNYSALLLAETIRLSNVTAFLKSYGFNKSELGIPPQTTAEEIGQFFEKLYRGELVNSSYSDEMLGLLKQQRLRNKLPKYLPEKTIIAHKTGELDYFSHDSGIIYVGDRAYIIVILSENESRREADETIALISKGVYEYFADK